MSDLIRRDDVIDLIMETDPFWAEGTTRVIFNGVKKIRSSCVEPIVRCRDCKYWTQANVMHWGHCELSNGVCPDGDWFCADGERKDDE